MAIEPMMTEVARSGPAPDPRRATMAAAGNGASFATLLRSADRTNEPAPERKTSKDEPQAATSEPETKPEETVEADSGDETETETAATVQDAPVAAAPQAAPQAIVTVPVTILVSAVQATAGDAAADPILEGAAGAALPATDTSALAGTPALNGKLDGITEPGLELGLQMAAAADASATPDASQTKMIVKAGTGAAAEPTLGAQPLGMTADGEATDGTHSGENASTKADAKPDQGAIRTNPGQQNAGAAAQAAAAQIAGSEQASLSEEASTQTGTPALQAAPAATAAPTTAEASQLIARAPVLQQAASEQVAVHIQKAVRQGVDKITIHLNPAELGRVEVRLDVAPTTGRVNAVVAVDRPETLELLQRDARGLERALQDAGLKADGGLSFSLRDDNRGNQGNRAFFAFAEDGRQSGNRPEAVAEFAAVQRHRMAPNSALDIQV